MLKNIRYLIFISLFCFRGFSQSDAPDGSFSEAIIEQLEYEYRKELKDQRFQLIKSYFSDKKGLREELKMKEDQLDDELENEIETLKEEYKKQKKALYKIYKNEKEGIEKSFKEAYEQSEIDYKTAKKGAKQNYYLDEKEYGKDTAKENYRLNLSILKRDYKVKIKALEEEEKQYKEKKRKLYKVYVSNRKKISKEKDTQEENLKISINEILEKEEERVKTNKNEVKSNYKETKKNMTPGLINEVIVKVNEMKSIVKNLDPQALTFVTNGTRLSLKMPIDKYFLSDKGKPDSLGYAVKIASYLNSGKGIFLGWKGENNDKARTDAALLFYHNIKSYILEEAAARSIPTGSVPVNLVGHSHGGNIMIMVANLLKDDGYFVQVLLTLGTPGREYQLNHSIPHIQIYSYQDSFMKAGGWDFDILFFDLKFGQSTEEKFKNAINLNISFFLNEDIYRLYEEDYSKLYSKSNIQHQILRYADMVKIILDGQINPIVLEQNG